MQLYSPFGVVLQKLCIHLIVFAVQILEGDYQSYKRFNSDNSYELLDCARDGHIQDLRQLFASGANINRKFDKTETTALHVAVRNNQVATVKFLLEQGADPNATNRKYETPLHVAAKVGRLEPLHVLLHSGCSTEKQDNKSYTPIFTACEYKHFDIVKELIKSGVNVSITEATDRTLLHVTGNRNIINILVRKGLNVDAKDGQGNTPLHAAALSYNEEWIDALVDLGANPTLTNEKGETPLVLAENQIWKRNKNPVERIREAQKIWTANHDPEKTDSFSDQNKGSNQEIRLVLHHVDKLSQNTDVPDTMAGNKEKNIRLQNTKESNDYIKPKQSKETLRRHKKNATNAQSKQNHLEDQTAKGNEYDAKEIPHKEKTQRQKENGNAGHIKENNLKDKKTNKNDENREPMQFRKMNRQQRKNLLMKDVEDKTLALVSLEMTGDDENRLPVGKDKRGHLKKDYKDNKRLRYFQILRYLKQKYPHRKAYDLLKGIKRKMSSPMKEVALPEEDWTVLEAEELSKETLMLISRTLPHLYFHFGLLVDLSFDKMTEIELSYKDNSEEQCYQTLMSWKKRFPDGKCATLIKALMNIGLPYESAFKSIIECR